MVLGTCRPIVFAKHSITYSFNKHDKRMQYNNKDENDMYK